MSISSRSFLITNIALVLLIGIMFWYISKDGQSNMFGLFSPGSEPVATKVMPVASTPEFSTEGLSKKDIQAIATLQAQLEQEKAIAEKTRTQLLARLQENTSRDSAKAFIEPNSEAASAPLAGLDIEQQKQQIEQMIKAQLKGAEQENKRLTQALLKRNQEIIVVKQQNTDLTKKLVKLDDSTQALLDTLVKDGKNISRSDQDYLGAMQTLQNETTPSQQAAGTSNTDLINRVEVSDSGDTGSIATELRTLVDNLMEAKDQAKPDTQNTATIAPSSGQSSETQTTAINTQPAQNAGIENIRQFEADADYLDSLTPVEIERFNETRWVTVREGDTLYDIAARVYSNGWEYRKIYSANPQILNNPDLIKIGQRLRVPL